MSDPIIVLHTADLHFGRRWLRATRGGDNIRELDVYRVGELVSTWAAETLKPDLMIVAGDVWDDSRPSSQALGHGYDFHARPREAGIPIVVIGGNHDTVTTPGRPTPLQHLENYFGCHVMLEQSEMEIAGIQVCAVPYRTLSTGELRDPDYSDQIPSLLVVHADADGDDLPDFAKFSYVRLPREKLFDPRAQLRLLGHVHIHQQIGEHAYYSGALERLTWGELPNDPAVYVHRIYEDGRVETETVLVSSMGDGSAPRPALDLTLNCQEMEAGNVVDAALAKLEASQLDEHLVRITMQNAPQDLYAINYEETLIRRAMQRGAFALKARVQLREDKEFIPDAETLEQLPQEPGAALSEHYRGFAERNGDKDIADLGCQLIAQASGEVAESSVA